MTELLTNILFMNENHGMFDNLFILIEFLLLKTKLKLIKLIYIQERNIQTKKSFHLVIMPVLYCLF